MSKYADYYNKAVDLYKAGNNIIYRSMIYGNDLYSDYEAKILDKAIFDVSAKAYQLSVKHHPTWFAALMSGASSTECLRAWRNDDPNMEYLAELKHI